MMTHANYARATPLSRNASDADFQFYATLAFVR